MTTSIDAPLTARTRWVITAMASAAFLAVLNGTTVTASLEALGPELGTSMSGTVWVTTVYLIAASASVPLMGWLAARLGPGRVFQLALLGFAVGSLLCGFAWDLGSMVVFRVVQGLAGGMLEPSAIAMIGVVTPRSRVGRIMGVVSLVINVGPVAGPLLGSTLVSAGAWEWIFWVNVPIAAVIGVTAWRLLPSETERGERVPLDGAGLLLLPPGFVLLLLAFNRWGAGADVVWVAGLAALGLTLLILYVVHARRATAPLLDIRLLASRPFAAALGIMSGVGLIMYTQLTVLPTLATRSLGLTGAWQTAPVAVLGVGLMVSMTLAGRLSDTFGSRAIVGIGGVATALTAVLVLGVRDRPVWVVLIVLLVVGLAFGAIAAPAFASIYRVLPPAQVAAGTAALFIVVQLFASAGTTLVGFLTAQVADPVGAAYAVIAAASTVIAGVSTLLPGRTRATSR